MKILREVLFTFSFGNKWFGIHNFILKLSCIKYLMEILETLARILKHSNLTVSLKHSEVFTAKILKKKKKLMTNFR